jgi:FMN reductase
MTRPLILGLGGTTRAGSSSERVLRAALREVEALGARTEMLAGPDLVIPLYAPELPERSPEAERLIGLLRRCDGVIIASPGYHGSISGMIKNALDYAEDTARDARPYLDGRPVGCIACAYGWQATGSTLIALRTIVHALRGWPTPLGVAANTTLPLFDAAGDCIEPGLKASLAIMATQVMRLATANCLAGMDGPEPAASA